MQQCCKNKHYLCNCNTVALNFYTVMKSARNSATKTKIQELIVSSSVALSHSDIQKTLKGLCDRVTIYRILNRLLEEGVIHKIVDVDGVVVRRGRRRVRTVVVRVVVRVVICVIVSVVVEIGIRVVLSSIKV